LTRLLAAALILAGGAVEAAEATYGFDPRADRFLEVFFPPRVLASGLTNAYLTRGTPAALRSLNDVYVRNIWGTNLAVDEPSWIDAPDAIDSYWLSVPRGEARLRQLMAAVTPDVVDLVEGLARSRPRFGSVLEKALFQRDVWQVFSFCSDLMHVELSAPEAARRNALLEALAALMRELRLSEEEYRALLDARAGRVDRGRFSDANPWDLSVDYLPRRVLGEAPGWHPLPFTAQASRHFRFFRGRSFIQIDIKPPGMSADDFYRYWDRLHRKFGSDIHLHTGQPPLPEKTELLLLRTFGLFLQDGTYVDSTLPEEVLLRLFKHQRPRLDRETSDYRGTLLYQYKLNRRELLADGSRLGLRRTAEDAPQFYGFFGEAPDPYNSYSDSISTMRFNCIACHSEHQYGVGTVFSMTRKPVLPSAPVTGSLQDAMLEAARPDGRFRLCTEEARQLATLTGGAGRGAR